MKLKPLIIFLLASGLLISSCKKDSTNTTPTYSIQGLWIGTYTVTDQASLGTQYFSFIIKPDGTLFVESKGGNVQYLGKGTWILTGNSFSCTYTNIYSDGPPSVIGIVQTATATFDNSGKLNSGTWTTPSNTVHGAGTFTLNRIN